MTTDNLFVFAMEEPIMLPTGLIPISTPNRKMDNPIIISKAPARNPKSIEVSRGAIVKCKINTMTVIGRTEYITSLTRENNTFK